MKKVKQLPIRVSQEEKEGFERAAELSGLGLSSWVRQKLRAAALIELKSFGEDIPFMKSAKEGT